MGGHGGLNILPQKKWNVYNFDNREKVRKDEEEAAKQEQIKHDESRKHQSQLRLQLLRQSKNIDPIQSQNDDDISSVSAASSAVVEEEKPKPQDSNHMNLFEGIRIFDPVKIGEDGKKEEKKGKFWRESKKVKKEEVRAVGPEDEVYRVGYGVVGKGVKLPWYLEKKENGRESDSEESSDGYEVERVSKKRKMKTKKKKSLEELREERVKRERAEKERERALVLGKTRMNGGFSTRRR